MTNRTEIKLEFVGTSGINSFIANVSSPRACMDASHLNQRPSLIHPEKKIVLSGIEYELGKYINDVKTEHDCVVKGVVSKYRGKDGPSPETMLFVEYERKGELWIDMIDIPCGKSMHGFFGYRLEQTEALTDAYYNAPIPADTILAKADSYNDDGSYMCSVNANAVFMSHPSVAEDGFVVSEGFLKKLQFTTMTKRVINITKDTVPVNLYGNSEKFKFIPDVGEMVRPDGILCATKPRNDWFSIVDMSDTGISELDHTFDDPIYVPPGSVVVDVNVIKGNLGKPEFTERCTEQLDEMADDLVNYYKNIISTYEKLILEKKQMYGDTSSIRQTPRLRRYIADIMIKVSSATTGRTKLSYRKLPVDQYRVEVTLMSVVTPTLGFKLSDLHASKGVICKILPDECMPVDSNGVRADIIADNNSTISRMNLGRVYEHYLGATSRDNRLRLINMLQNRLGSDYRRKLTEEVITDACSYLRGLYGFINSEMVAFIDGLSMEEKQQHLLECIDDNIYIYYPTDNENNIVDVISNIENSEYKPHMGKVTYMDELGRLVTTEDDIRVGNLAIMLLEKVAMDYSSVSYSKVNSFNFPIKGSGQDKFKYPHSLTPTKTLGETEVRIMSSFSDPVLVAELIDLALNPVSHKQLIKNILESDETFSTEQDIDREVIPYGNTSSLLLLKHIFNAAGFDFEYNPEQ